MWQKKRDSQIGFKNLVYGIYKGDILSAVTQRNLKIKEWKIDIVDTWI